MAKEKTDEKGDKSEKNISDLVKSVSSPQNIHSNDDTLKNLELAKIIVKEILNPNHLDSLSSISNIQVTDFTNAKLLNTYYRIPEIDEYIDNFLSYKRSENALLLRTFERMIMNNQDETLMGKKGFFDRILKR